MTYDEVFSLYQAWWRIWDRSMAAAEKEGNTEKIEELNEAARSITIGIFQRQLEGKPEPVKRKNGTNIIVNGVEGKFEIMGFSNSNLYCNGKKVYSRIFIRRVKEEEEDEDAEKSAA